MRNGESINITHSGKAYIKGARQLFLNNLLRVSKIKKTLSAFLNLQKTIIYFEFYPKYYLIRDILTKEILLQGGVDRGQLHQSCKRIIDL